MPPQSNFVTKNICDGEVAGVLREKSIWCLRQRGSLAEAPLTTFVKRPAVLQALSFKMASSALSQWSDAPFPAVPSLKLVSVEIAALICDCVAVLPASR